MLRTLTDDHAARAATTPIRERIETGDWYCFGNEPSLQATVAASSRAIAAINGAALDDLDRAAAMLRDLAPGLASDARVMFPVRGIEYPEFLTVGEGTFINSGLHVLSAGRVTIGANCFIGPDCRLYTPNHSADPVQRRAGWQYDAPITIGDDCWFGGSVIVLSGVTIGSGVIVGAGSVVTHPIPNNTTVAGNPARRIR